MIRMGRLSNYPLLVVMTCHLHDWVIRSTWLSMIGLNRSIKGCHVVDVFGAVLKAFFKRGLSRRAVWCHCRACRKS